ncbi:MAG: hypothetical protein ABR526_10650 [Chthoniobacterales bacterium]
MQVTLLSRLPFVPLFGEGTIDHDVPFQRSISVSSMLPLFEEPTAQQLEAEGQVTLASALLFEDLFGEDTIVQAAPFQCSISVCAKFEDPLRNEPTAQQSSADTQATPETELLVPTFGEVTIDHSPTASVLAAKLEVAR